MHKKQGFALPRRGPAGKRWAEFREIVPMAAVQAEKTMDSAENGALADRPRGRAGRPVGGTRSRTAPDAGQSLSRVCCPCASTSEIQTIRQYKGTN